MIAERIKEKRKAAGLTQKELAEKLKVDQAHISKWERGENTPSIEKLVQISDILKCTVDELVR